MARQTGMETTMTTTTIQYLGSNCDCVGNEAFLRAGVDPATHELLSWHDRSEIDQARAEGRLVAEFTVRQNDPACYVARRAEVRKRRAAPLSSLMLRALTMANNSGGTMLYAGKAQEGWYGNHVPASVLLALKRRGLLETMNGVYFAITASGRMVLSKPEVR